MIGRHISGAFGRIVRAPVSTGANILTLALGLAAFILAWGVVAWWQSSDGHFANAGRIQVMTQKLSLVSDGRSSGASSATSEPLAKYLREDFPGLEAVARLRGVGEISVKADGREMKARVPNQSVTAVPGKSDEKGSVRVRRVDVEHIKMMAATCQP